MSTLNVNNINEVGGVDAVISSGILDKGSLPTGSILQVVSTTKTDTFSASVAQGAETTVSDLSASITPTSADSKILVQVSVSSGQTSLNAGQWFTLFRGASALVQGDSAGSRQTVTGGSQGSLSDGAAEQSITSIYMSYLDSPATTSTLTYSVKVSHGRAGTTTVYVNRSQTDSDLNYLPRGASTITLMEVAG